MTMPCHKVAEFLRQEAEARNQNFVKQQLVLPSGATYTLCRPGTVAASELEMNERGAA